MQRMGGVLDPGDVVDGEALVGGPQDRGDCMWDLGIGIYARAEGLNAQGRLPVSQVMRSRL